MKNMDVLAVSVHCRKNIYPGSIRWVWIYCFFALGTSMFRIIKIAAEVWVFLFVSLVATLVLVLLDGYYAKKKKEYLDRKKEV